MKNNQKLIIFTDLSQNEEADLSGGQVIISGIVGRGGSSHDRDNDGAGVVIIISDSEDVDPISLVRKKLIAKRLKARTKRKHKKLRF